MHHGYAGRDRSMEKKLSLWEVLGLKIRGENAMRWPETNLESRDHGASCRLSGSYHVRSVFIMLSSDRSRLARERAKHLCRSRSLDYIGHMLSVR